MAVIRCQVGTEFGQSWVALPPPNPSHCPHSSSIHPYQQGSQLILLGSSSSPRLLSRSDSGTYPGYIGSGTKSSGGGDCGSSGPGPQDFPSDMQPDADLHKCNYVCLSFIDNEARP
ncbi:hypothetical protein Tco_0128205 [Tanacetum coccineum]